MLLFYVYILSYAYDSNYHDEHQANVEITKNVYAMYDYFTIIFLYYRIKTNKTYSIVRIFY